MCGGIRMYAHVILYIRTYICISQLRMYTILGQPLACVVSSALNVFSLIVCGTWSVNH